MIYMRNYFIDLENVRSAGLEGVHSLEEDDNVYVFYSDNANTLTIPTLESISSSKARVQYIKINCYGSNAMDFQIVAMFGAMIEREKRGSFYIISHDNGFKSAVSFCRAFFSDLKLTMGAYATIQATLGENNQQDDDETRVEMTVQSSRPSRRRRSKASPAVKETEVLQKDVKQNTAKPQKAAVQKAAAQKAPRKKPAAKASLDYIYDVFKELLSEKTISIYAEAIHECMCTSKNKNDVKKFFETRYGDREGEALCKLVQSEYDKLKSLAQK